MVAGYRDVRVPQGLARGSVLGVLDRSAISGDVAHAISEPLWVGSMVVSAAAPPLRWWACRLLARYWLRPGCK